MQPSRDENEQRTRRLPENAGSNRRRHLEQNRARSGEKIYIRVKAGFELATFRLRKGIQQEIAASERGCRRATYIAYRGNLDTTDTHTPTPEVPRRTSSVRNLRRPWASRVNIPSRGRRKATHPLLAQCPPLCVANWGTLSCAVRASGGGTQSHLSCVRVGSVSSLGGGQEGKNI